MANRRVTSIPVKVYLPTGMLKLYQVRTTDTPSRATSTGGMDGHQPLSAVNEVQRLVITGSPSGGTFTLTFRSQTTSSIAYNATATAVQTALAALSTIGSGNVTVTAVNGDLPASSLLIEFKGTLAQNSLPLITATSFLTGGSTPAIAITQVQDGAPVFDQARPNVGDDAHMETTLYYDASPAPMIKAGQASNRLTGTVNKVNDSLAISSGRDGYSFGAGVAPLVTMP